MSRTQSKVLEEYRYWKPEAQARALAMLEERGSQAWHPFYCTNPGCNGHPHCVPKEDRPCEAINGHPWTLDEDQWHLPQVWHCEACGALGSPVDGWIWEHARADQRPPRWADKWMTWLLSGGRGSGKTRTGAEVTHQVSERIPRIILIAPTGPDLRETMVEGVSGILACAAPDKYPKWESSKKKLTWPNGAVALGFSAEEPDRLRGPASGFIWADEVAHYPNPEEVMDNALFGMREKNKSGLATKVCSTTTPKPTKWMKKLIADPATVTHRVSTYANVQNLNPAYRDTVLSKYEGTRTGRQELYGEVLEDIEGALWNWNMFKHTDKEPALTRIVVSVDPAGTANKRSDETGIVVVGLGHDGLIYVLADWTAKLSPAGWADRAVAAYDTFKADAIVAEKNYGGDMVKNTLENSRAAKVLAPRIILVDSRRGKDIRAEPVVALYEKTKVWHVSTDPESGIERTNLSEMETEQTEWVPGESPSPNRVDALVHGITEVGKATMPAQIAMPSQIPQRAQVPGVYPASPVGRMSGIYSPGFNPYQ